MCAICCVYFYVSPNCGLGKNCAQSAIRFCTKNEKTTIVENVSKGPRTEHLTLNSESLLRCFVSTFSEPLLIRSCFEILSALFN